jgi:HD domain
MSPVSIRAASAPSAEVAVPPLPAGSDRADIVGTAAWAAAGGPPLTRRQRLGQLRLALGAYLGELPSEVRWELAALGLLSAPPVTEVGVMALPDTRAVEAAVGELERLAEGEREIVGHSYRTFHFADVLHRQSGEPPLDRELLAVAMLLHDVGMFPRAIAEEPANEFTVRGAQIARRVASEAGWAPGRIEHLVQVVTINANGAVPRRWGPEAYFGRLAPIVDAAGQVWKVHPDDARRIFTAHPLGALDRAIMGAVRAEVRRQPSGRFSVFAPMFPMLLAMCQRRWARRLG